MSGFLSYLLSLFSHYDTAKIQLGNSKEDVGRIFGQPDNKISWLGLTESTDKEDWIYYAGLGVGATVTFNKAGKVIAVCCEKR